MGTCGLQAGRAPLLYAGLEEYVELELLTQSLIGQLLLLLDVICQGVQLREQVLRGDTRIVCTGRLTVVVHHPLFN